MPSLWDNWVLGPSDFGNPLAFKEQADVIPTPMQAEEEYREQGGIVK